MFRRLQFLSRSSPSVRTVMDGMRFFVQKPQVAGSSGGGVATSRNIELINVNSVASAMLAAARGISLMPYSEQRPEAAPVLLSGGQVLGLASVLLATQLNDPRMLIPELHDALASDVGNIGQGVSLSKVRTISLSPRIEAATEARCLDESGAKVDDQSLHRLDIEGLRAFAKSIRAWDLALWVPPPEEDYLLTYFLKMVVRHSHSRAATPTAIQRQCRSILMELLSPSVFYSGSDKPTTGQPPWQEWLKKVREMTPCSGSVSSDGADELAPWMLSDVYLNNDFPVAGRTAGFNEGQSWEEKEAVRLDRLRAALFSALDLYRGAPWKEQFDIFLLLRWHLSWQQEAKGSVTQNASISGHQSHAAESMIRYFSKEAMFMELFVAGEGASVFSVEDNLVDSFIGCVTLLTQSTRDNHSGLLVTGSLLAVPLERMMASIMLHSHEFSQDGCLKLWGALRLLRAFCCQSRNRNGSSGRRNNDSLPSDLMNWSSLAEGGITYMSLLVGKKLRAIRLSLEKGQRQGLHAPAEEKAKFRDCAAQAAALVALECCGGTQRRPAVVLHPRAYTFPLSVLNFLCEGQMVMVFDSVGKCIDDFLQSECRNCERKLGSELLTDLLEDKDGEFSDAWEKAFKFSGGGGGASSSSPGKDSKEKSEGTSSRRQSAGTRDSHSDRRKHYKMWSNDWTRSDRGMLHNTDFDKEALELLKHFETYCGLPTTPLRHVKLVYIGRLMESLEDDFEEGNVSSGAIKRYLLLPKEVDELASRYCLLAQIPQASTLPVKAELRNLVGNFSNFITASSSDDDGEGNPSSSDNAGTNSCGGDCGTPAGVTPQLSDDNMLDELPLEAQLFLEYAQTRKDLKYLTLAILTTALTDPGLRASQIIEMVTVSTKTTVFQKHIAEVTGMFKPTDMHVRVELCSLVRDFCLKNKSKFPIRSAAQPRAIGGTTASVGSSPLPGDPKRHPATTAGFLAFCKERNDGKPFPHGLNLPDWDILAKILEDGNASEADCIEALTAIGVPHPSAERITKLFPEFHRAHGGAARRRPARSTGRSVNALDDDDDYWNGGNSSSNSRALANRQEEGSDSDASYHGAATSYLSRRFMTEDEQMKAYLGGHPEIKDCPRMNKNIDFYRGAMKMQPYNCFIDDFHARSQQPPEATVTRTVAAGEGEATAMHRDPSDDMTMPTATGTSGRKTPTTNESKSTLSTGSKKSSTSSKKSSNAWYGNYSRLEYEHSYIQWLFPLQEGGGMSSTSQSMQKHELAMIRKDAAVQARFRRSYEMMLDFFGMALVDSTTGKIDRSADYFERYHNLNTSSHNYLRITRILKCLGDVGFEHFKFPFLKFVLEEMYVNRELPNCCSSCKGYWMKTLRNPQEREEIVALQATLEEEHGSVAPSYSYSYSYGGTTTGGGKSWWEEEDDDWYKGYDFAGDNRYDTVDDTYNYDVESSTKTSTTNATGTGAPSSTPQGSTEYGDASLE